jgi:hypothetical protein
LIEHDILIRLVGKHSEWLKTPSWLVAGGYSSDAPNGRLLAGLEKYAPRGELDA